VDRSAAPATILRNQGFSPRSGARGRSRSTIKYTYYLDLDAEWRCELRGDTVRVRAPEIQFNEPAIGASRIEYEVRQGSVLRDETAALAKLR
jgi:hypothetical protein